MTKEAICRDRRAFSTAVFEAASTDLANLGIVIVSYTVKDVIDDVRVFIYFARYVLWPY